MLLSVDEDPQRIAGIESVGSLDRPVVADLDDLRPRPLTLGTSRDRLPVVVLARDDCRRLSSDKTALPTARFGVEMRTAGECKCQSQNNAVHDWRHNCIPRN